MKHGYMRLSEYPAAIAEATRTVNAIDQEIAMLRQAMAREEGQADVVVAFEEKLKNENQRKARRFEILEDNPEYQSLHDKMVQVATQKSNAIAHLEYLRNQFSVVKLEARWAIAEKLVGLETRELVGL